MKLHLNSNFNFEFKFEFEFELYFEFEVEVEVEFDFGFDFEFKVEFEFDFETEFERRYRPHERRFHSGSGPEQIQRAKVGGANMACTVGRLGFFIIPVVIGPMSGLSTAGRAPQTNPKGQSPRPNS